MFVIFALVVFSPGGSRRCRAASKEVSGGRGKPTAPERLPESSGRGLGDDFLLEAFSRQVWSFSVLLGRVQVAPGGHELRPRRSLEVRGSPRLQNGGLRALERPWVTTFCLRHFPVKCRRFLCFGGASRWLQEMTSCVPGVPGGQGKPKAPER